MTVAADLESEVVEPGLEHLLQVGGEQLIDLAIGFWPACGRERMHSSRTSMARMRLVGPAGRVVISVMGMARCRGVRKSGLGQRFSDHSAVQPAGSSEGERQVPLTHTSPAQQAVYSGPQSPQA